MKERKQQQKKKKAETGKGKPWKQFEKLVAGIEKFLGPELATVKSPDKVPDLNTGTLREVDASIRLKIGSTPVLIVIECRDRSQKQDVTWIEQLESKKKNIGASVLIAVSSKGFSAEGKVKGRSCGIELRTLGKVKPESMLDSHIYFGWQNYDHLSFQLAFFTTDIPDGGEVFEREIRHKYARPENEKILVHNDETISVNELVDSIMKGPQSEPLNSLYQGVTNKSGTITVTLNFEYGAIYLPTSKGK